MHPFVKWVCVQIEQNNPYKGVSSYLDSALYGSPVNGAICLNIPVYNMMQLFKPNAV